MVREQDLEKTYLATAAIHSAWASAWLDDFKNGATELRLALATYERQGNKFYVPFYMGLLAQIEAETESVDAALGTIEAALALAAETGEHWSDGILHHIRGEVLLKREPPNIAPAEKALLLAIAVAQEQKARTIELRAALSLANIYQTVHRTADAHAVLAPALEGFSPTPELPEIEEAKALLASLAKSDEVKSALETRERRLKLQTAYGLAVSWSRGFATEKQRPHSLARGNLAQSPKTRTSDSPACTGSGSLACRVLS